MKNHLQTVNSNDILPVRKYGDPILREKVKRIIDFNPLPRMVQKMFATMYEEGGIGLAANQVGWSIDLLVFDTSCIDDEDDNKQYTFINNKIIKKEGKIILEEGCLSVPEIRAKIERPEAITLRYQDLSQNTHEKKFTGMVSRVIQHELDHLNGKLFIDYLSPAKRILINKRLLEISKYGNPSTGLIL
tara:strand:+ start:67 stop:630 length:564 start_codon:yes stop_codon:yes gene_type:complete